VCVFTPGAFTVTATTSHPSRRAEFWAGGKDTLPLEIGAIPFGIIFGAVAITSGLSPLAAAGMSAFVYAGSAQFIGAGLVAAGTPIPIIILTTFVVNLRHALYGASLGPYMRHLPQRWVAPLGFWLTDETYVVVIQRFERGDDAPYRHWYYLGSALFMYVNWQVWTWVGIFAGQNIQDPNALGLDFAMVVTFIGMMVPLLRSRALVVAFLVSSVASVLASGLPNNLNLIVAPLLGVIAGVLAQSVWGKPTPHSAKNQPDAGP
jgi:4-azaleucine resistance transporter AzlC